MRTVTRLLLATLAIAACSEDRELQSHDDTSTSLGATTSSSASTGTATPDLGAAESTGPTYPLPTEDELLQCVRGCEFPADCCPPGTLGDCPATSYPYDFACIEGLCVAPPCLSNDECPGEGEVCILVRGTPRCVTPCNGDDAPCTAVDASLTCSGTADDQSLYCFAHCENPGVFCGNQTCDPATGECVCTSSGMCQSGWECV